MRGAIPPPPNTSSLRGTYLSTGTSILFYLTLLERINSCCLKYTGVDML
jgi:hypothetical protein